MARDWNRRTEISKVLPWFEDWKFDWLDVPALHPRVRSKCMNIRWLIAIRCLAGVSGEVTLLGDAAHPYVSDWFEWRFAGDSGRRRAV